jgi:excisionase family DNA binding protein
MNQPQPPQISVSVRDAARLTALSERYLRSSISDGTLPAHRVEVGTGERPRIVVLHSELEQFVKGHPAAAEEN